jgi:hypothetical protein
MKGGRREKAEMEERGHTLDFKIGPRQMGKVN